MCMKQYKQSLSTHHSIETVTFQLFKDQRVETKTQAPRGDILFTTYLCCAPHTRARLFEIECARASFGAHLSEIS